MYTSQDYPGRRLLQRIEPTPQLNLDLADLRASEWSTHFEKLMRNRLVQGAARYGKLHAKGKPQYDRVSSIQSRIEKYKQTGNLEHLVDVANLCLCEFEEPTHPRAHFEMIDDGEHVEVSPRGGMRVGGLPRGGMHFEPGDDGERTQVRK